MTDLPDQILALINTVTENNVKNTGPQIVHGGWYVLLCMKFNAVIFASMLTVLVIY